VTIEVREKHRLESEIARDSRKKTIESNRSAFYKFVGDFIFKKTTKNIFYQALLNIFLKKK
jgi:hypothetical protein